MELGDDQRPTNIEEQQKILSHRWLNLANQYTRGTSLFRHNTGSTIGTQLHSSRTCATPSISTSRSLPLPSTAQKAPQALVERQSYCLIANRTKETLTSAIKQFVAPGSTFISDCWCGYNSENLAKIGIDHKTVSRFFVFFILVVSCYKSIIRKTS